MFNPLCIRWSDIEDNTAWAETTANNAGEWILESGGRIVCARVIGEYVLVWTTVSLFLGTFIGDPGQTWRFERVGANCGAIGPNAPVVSSQNSAWIAPDGQLWTYSLQTAPAGDPGLPDPLHVRSTIISQARKAETRKSSAPRCPPFAEVTVVLPRQPRRPRKTAAQSRSARADGIPTLSPARPSWVTPGRW